MPDNASIMPVQSREWAVFGLLQNLCVLGVSIVAWILVCQFFTNCALNRFLQHVCGVSVGLELVMIYVRIQLLIKWIKTN
jgi:hypothetical protein